MTFKLSEEKKLFKDHVATFTDLGSVKIVDFAKPDSSEFHIRFLFDEDCYTLHITGDIGTLTAVNNGNMVYNKFLSFVDSPSYFEEKVHCCSRKLYRYDEPLAIKELRKMIREDETARQRIKETYDYMDKQADRVSRAIIEILEDYSEETGLSQDGYDIASQYIDDFWEVANSLGKVSTGVIQRYLLAFQLAKKQLNHKQKEGRKI